MEQDRSLTVDAPELWNSLPINLRQKTSVQSFKKALRQIFFSQTNRVRIIL